MCENCTPQIPPICYMSYQRGKDTEPCEDIKQAYRLTPLHDLGQSDRISLLLIPAYIPLRKKKAPPSTLVMATDL